MFLDETSRSEASSVAGLADGRAVLLSALARALTPPPRLSVSEWAEAQRYVAAESGSPQPGKWHNELVPYMVEVMDVLTLSHPAREVVLKKSHQTGGTEAAVNLFGYVVDQAPAAVLYVLPSLEEAHKFNKIKLQPTIDATPCLSAKVRDAKSRDEDGSTGSLKRFRGGFFQLTGANSSKGLQMISARVLVCDEVSEWPADVGKRGDPVAQAELRTTAYDVVGYKRFYLSTPAMKGACRVSAKFEASDQRRFYVRCPHCGARQALVWKHMTWRSEQAPHGAWYACAANGCAIEHHEKRALVAGGVWIKTYPGDDQPPLFFDEEDLPRHRARPSAGRQPGFHIWQGYSLLATWDSMVAKWLEVKDNPTQLKAFVQQVLGEEWEERGEAPEWQRLAERAEDYREGTVPLGGLVLTGAADVQKTGIYYEVVAWGEGLTSWVVEAGFLAGNPADEADPVWRKLDEVQSRRWPDAYGNMRELDAFAVDSGYQANAVYNWVRGKPKALAIKGQPGWYHPPIGVPTRQDITRHGKKRRRGAMLWPIGTWPLKSALYANLRKVGRRGGAEQDPPGYCHFGDWLPQAYYQQLTAEYLAERESKGRIVREWMRAGDNHWHDTRIYNMAMAEHLGLSRPGFDWAALAAVRNVPANAPPPDLVDRMRRVAPPPASAAPVAADPAKSRESISRLLA